MRMTVDFREGKTREDANEAIDRFFFLTERYQRFRELCISGGEIILLCPDGEVTVEVSAAAPGAPFRIKRGNSDATY